MNNQKEILLKIKKAVKKIGFIDINWPDEIPEEIDRNDNYIWIGTSDGLIGGDDCHYEYIFHAKEPEILSLEVHIDEKKNQKWFENLIETDSLVFKRWNSENGRIVFKNKEDYINIEENNEEEIVSKALELLKRLDEEIGQELRNIMITHLPERNDISPELSDSCGKIVSVKHYKARTEKSASEMNTLHGKIQEKLTNYLVATKKYTEVSPEKNFKNLPFRLDLLAKLKDSGNYEIYEVKPYATALECIRVALGQLLFYKVLLEKGHCNVDKIVIVGPTEITKFEEVYFEAIKSMLKSTIKLEYLSV